MLNLGDLIGSWYRAKGDSRQDNSGWPQQVKSPLDIPNALINDAIARGIAPFIVETVNLSTAGSKVINYPGTHVVIYGHDGSTNKAVNTTAYMQMWWGDTKKGSNGFPLKHARGFSSPFGSLYLEWPAQANVYVDIVVFNSIFQPWQDGESCT